MKIRAWLHRHVLYPFLLPLFFVLHTKRYLSGNIPLSGALQVLGLYLLIVSVIYLLVRKGSRHAAGAGLAAVLLMSLFIYWAEIIRFINKALHTQNFTHLPAVLLLWTGLSLGAAWLLNRSREAARGRMVFFLNSLFLLYIGVEAGLIAVQAFRGNSKAGMIHLSPLSVHPGRAAANSPDVYLLLFDEYASSASLAEEWSYDNSAADSALLRRGFHLNRNSRSNYQMTFFSMASMLNMDYLDSRFEKKEIVGPDYPECKEWIDRARIVSIFRNAGYVFENRSIFEVGGQPKPDVHDILVSGRELLTVNNLYHVAMRDYLPYLKNRQAIRHDPEFHDPSFYYLDTYNNNRIAQLLREAGRGARPRFVYAHLLTPHSPFFYDSVGNYLPVRVAKSTIEFMDPKLYCYNVHHANQVMLQLVDTILAREQGNAVILVMGDHGFRPQQPVKNRYGLFRNYNAWYLPNGDYSSLPDTMTNVNAFRILCNKLFNTGYPLLPDRSVELLGEPH